MDSLLHGSRFSLVLTCRSPRAMSCRLHRSGHWASAGRASIAHRLAGTPPAPGAVGRSIGPSARFRLAAFA